MYLENCVYVVRQLDAHCNMFKIGMSSYMRLRSRVHTLQIGNPNELELYATLPGWGKEGERNFHRLLIDYRVRGEWFKLPEMFLLPLDILREMGNCDFPLVSQYEFSEAFCTAKDIDQFKAMVRFSLEEELTEEDLGRLGKSLLSDCGEYDPNLWKQCLEPYQ